jgi:hypothetical protein
MSNSAYATIQDVITLSGKMYTAEEQERIGALLPLVSDALRYEAVKVGKDLDQMIENDTTGAYASVVKLVTVDILVRVMRQNMEGEPMSQESQSGLGYTWSGTYAIAGGGIAAAILRNDLKRLGLRVQRYGMEAMYGR